MMALGWPVFPNESQFFLLTAVRRITFSTRLLGKRQLKYTIEEALDLLEAWPL